MTSSNVVYLQALQSISVALQSARAHSISVARAGLLPQVPPPSLPAPHLMVPRFYAARPLPDIDQLFPGSRPLFVIIACCNLAAHPFLPVKHRPIKTRSPNSRVSETTSKIAKKSAVKKKVINFELLKAKDFFSTSSIFVDQHTYSISLSLSLFIYIFK